MNFSSFIILKYDGLLLILHPENIINIFIRGAKVPCFIITKLMISKDHITGIVQEQLTEDDFIVEITIDSHNKISISIDNKSGISIDRCVKISRHVERNLDRDIEDFELVVSSPGLDSEFKVPEQYEKNLGKEISVQKKSGEKLTGKLLEFTGEKITLEEKKKIKVGKKKKEVLENTDIYINEINKVKAVISFK